MVRTWFCLIPIAAVAMGLLSCSPGDQPENRAAGSGVSKPLTFGVAFETLQTEYWVTSIEAIKSELDRRGITMIQAIADGDANRQFEQINNFISQGVDGIIVSPKDGQTVIPMIKAANRGNIPIVCYNRPPADSTAKAVTVVADNFKIAKETVQYMIEQANRQGGTYKAAILIGDLGDFNSIERRDGFEAAFQEFAGDNFEIVARIPTDWVQEKALAGLTNALQANPDINFIFTSSDLFLPSIKSVLKTAGKYHKIGEPGHVVLGGFDGDATAYLTMVEGYLDATGVQDVYFECQQAVQALVDQIEGKEVPERILDPGFVIHQGNLETMKSRMWGANVAAGL